MRWATSSGCSMKFVVESSTPGMMTFPLISSEQGKVIAYARVSSPSQKKDLATQKEALRAYCLEHHIKVDQWMEDIGSALNYKRKGFNEIVEQIELGQVRRLIIAYQDRFVRF